MSMIQKGIVFFVLVIGGFLMRAFPFFSNKIPLGYDPGLYRSMFLSYQQLGSVWDFGALPTWIQQMYEPLLGMWGSLGGMIGGGWSDNVLTRGRAVVALLPLLGIWLMGKRYGSRVGIFAILLALISFTQWSVFWRAYRKQAIGMFLVAVIVRGRSKKWFWSMIPLIAAACLVTRTAPLIAGMIAFVWIVILLCSKRRERKQLFMSCGIAGLLAFPVLLPLRDSLIAPLFLPLFSSIHLPSNADSFQSGGTFLTIGEYFIVGGIPLVIGLGGRLLAAPSKQQSMLPVSLGWIVLMLRVFFQAFFFQRMLAYLDMFVLVYAAVAFDRLWQKKGWYRGAVLLVIGSCSVLIGYRIQRTYYPIIEQQEFAFLSQISTLPEDAVVVVPGIRYSPRVQGRTQRDVLAPGLFDLNRRGNLDQERTTKWYEVSAEQKCLSLLADYPHIRNRPLYLRIGSKQAPTSLAGSCFHVLVEGSGRSRRMIRF